MGTLCQTNNCVWVLYGSGSATGTMKIVALGSHTCFSADSGHCTAFHRVRGKNEDAKAKPVWMKFDDAVVREETVGHTNSEACKEWRKAATLFAYATVPGGSAEAKNAAVRGPAGPKKGDKKKKNKKKKNSSK